MPIAIAFKTPELEVPLGNIYPNNPIGLHGQFTDYNPYHPHFVVVRCASNDRGGYVYQAEFEDTGLFAPDAGLQGDPEPMLETIIGPNSYYERSITSKHGLGRLLLRHF